MATSTKWRLTITGGNADGVVEIAEWVLFDGVTDLCTGGTASADSEAANVAANAFDKDDATYWSRPAAAGAKWLQYEFATPVTNPTSYSITCRAGHGRPPGNHTLEYWNGAGWVVYWTQAVTLASWNAGVTQTFTPTGPPLGSRPRSAFGAQKPSRRRHGRSVG